MKETFCPLRTYEFQFGQVLGFNEHKDLIALDKMQSSYSTRTFGKDITF